LLPQKGGAPQHFAISKGMGGRDGPG